MELGRNGGSEIGPVELGRACRDERLAAVFGPRLFVHSLLELRPLAYGI